VSGPEIYNSYSNFFPLKVKQGKIFKISEQNRTNDSVYYRGTYYSPYPSGSAEETQPNDELLKDMILNQFGLALEKNHYLFKSDYRAYKITKELKHDDADIFRIFDGFEFRIIKLDSFLLCIDPKIIIKSSSIQDLYEKGVPTSILKDFYVDVLEEGEPRRAYLNEVLPEGNQVTCKVVNDYGEKTSPGILTKPDSRPEVLQLFLNALNRNHDIEKLKRKLTFLDSPTASKDRFEKTIKVLKEISQEISPLKFGNFEVRIEDSPLVIKV